MCAWRRHFVWIIGVWLLSQSSAMILVPVSLCAGNGASAIGQTCTCAHADGQECPMHHTKSKTRPQSSCSCRSTTDVPAATLASLLGPIAVLTSETTIAVTTAKSGLSLVRAVVLLNASINPDPPPPRS